MPFAGISRASPRIAACSLLLDAKNMEQFGEVVGPRLYYSMFCVVQLAYESHRASQTGCGFGTTTAATGARTCWSPSKVVREGLKLLAACHPRKRRKIIGLGKFDSGHTGLGVEQEAPGRLRPVKAALLDTGVIVAVEDRKEALHEVCKESVRAARIACRDL